MHVELKSFSLNRLLRWTGIGFVILWTIFPIYWMLNNSFKKRVDIFTEQPSLLPFNPTLANYSQLIIEMDFLVTLKNSLIVAAISTIIVVAIASLSAYSLSRYNFKGKKLILLWVILTRIFPPITFVIPLYSLMGSAGLLNTQVALILAYVAFNLPFGIWLLINFFNDIPMELEESATVDGASPFQAYRKIVLPLVAPGIGATAIFTFITAWNEFLYGLIFVQSQELMTAPVTLSGMITEYLVLWGPMSAGGILSLLPMLIFVLFMQKTMVSGLTGGAVKG
ncbi:multiple sugar transport system permease protein [Gracilibacillus ureilyticus]|uniref:Multiple sugar transport system permease protein n=1 Tax=Gracilibacillus ureilyticus TaxID=531814 RepID=A0A1H9UU94_9BACI|nr:carbohydrate ABC transporter permease [Gracilibacillus ureilyticus]SES12637.1 multiple sugar transport system permease protein [Gracilibacillus ureilyticus]